MAQIGVAQQAHGSIESEAFTFRSPSLGFIRNHLATERKHAVLDLGLPCGSNVDFFARVPCTLYVEDLFDSLPDLPPPDEDDGAESWIVASSSVSRTIQRCVSI